MRKENQRTIIIGLDGATWSALRPMVQKGQLPIFNELMQEGAYGNLLSTIPCRSSTAIATFLTGKNPCKWKMFDFISYDADAVSYERIREESQSIWDILGKFGYKSAILNLPTTYPPTALKGVMISGFSPSEKSEYTYPQDFKKNVEGFHSGREVFFDLIRGQVTIEKEKDLLGLYLRNARKRYDLIKSVIRDETFDFLVFWLDESDAVQHHFWGREDLLLTFFQEVDGILGDIKKNNAGTNIIVMSDHGFDARPVYEFYPKTWLEKEKYLILKGGAVQRWLTRRINEIVLRMPRNKYKYIRFVYSLNNKIKNLVLGKNKKENKKIEPEDRDWRLIRENKIDSRALGIDWKKTVATNYDFWGIKIIKENLNRSYEEIRNEIMEKMRRLTGENGEKVIKNVWKREEIFKGSDIQKFPDIVYLPASKFEPTGFLTSCIVRKKNMPKRKLGGVTGEHMTTREGIFIASGPGINNIKDLGELNMADITPTILSIFGVSVPEDMDGKIIKEIINL